MKPFYRLSPLLAALLIFASCQQKTTPVNQIGSSGGTVQFENNAVSVTVPANAINQDILLTGTTKTTGLASNFEILSGSSFELGPKDITFASPVSVSIKFNPSSLPAGVGASDLSLAIEENSQWVVVPSTLGAVVQSSTLQTRASSQTINAQLSRLGNIGIVRVKPTIVSLTATPNTLSTSGSVTLNWSVLGAKSISLDQGIGDVSSTNSKVVNVTSSKIFTLTATNANGTSTQSVNVSVDSAVNLIVAISSPSVAVATNGSLPIQVVVSGATADSVQLLRNGSPLVTLPASLNYTWNTTVEPEAVYNLVARATLGAKTFDSAALSVTVDRTGPSVVTNSRIPTPGDVNISAKSPITVQFSEAVLASSITNASVVLKKDAATLSKILTLSGDGKTLTITPTPIPATPANLNVSFSNTVTDITGNPLMAMTSVWNWTIPEFLNYGAALDITLGNKAITSSRSMALDSSSNPIVAWSENDGTSNNIYVKRWTGTAWSQVGTTFLNVNTNTNQVVPIPALALDSNGNPIVAWSESDGTSDNIYVKRWTGTAWLQVGTSFLDVNTNKDAVSPSIALDSNGNPVVAWGESDGTSDNIYVKRWTGSAWSQVGITFLDVNTDRVALIPALTLDSNGNPIVAWTENDGASYNIYVKRWTGTAWSQVGTTFLDIGINENAFFSSLALDSSNNPVVAWGEYGGTSLNIYVKRWTGTAWSQVGTTFLDVNTNQETDNPSLTLDSSNNPVVAWGENDGTSSNIYVKRWTGTTWSQVGTTFLDVNTNQNTRNPSLALDPNNNPVVAWTENDGTSDNIYVRRYNQ